MADPTVGNPSVERLVVVYENGEISALNAEVAYPIEYLDMNVNSRKTVDIWPGMSQNQKNQFTNFLDNIVS